ncbi:MAG: hypothetical protein ACQEW8_09755 [Actinomycetota bacterium]
MSARGRVARWVGVVVAGVVAVGVSGCAGVRELATAGVEDAAGMTRGEVAALSAEERFDLLGERYARMQELMTEAQEQVSTEPWNWLYGGVGGPTAGTTALAPLGGASFENSYYLEISRSINLPGAVGDRADAEPVYEYFVSKGWEARLAEPDTGGYRVHAVTDDGYHFEYWVQENGQYNMILISESFWADQNELRSNVMHRIPRGESFPESGESVPGVYIPFPKWTDPKLWGREITDDD